VTPIQQTIASKPTSPAAKLDSLDSGYLTMVDQVYDHVLAKVALPKDGRKEVSELGLGLFGKKRLFMVGNLIDMRFASDSPSDVGHLLLQKMANGATGLVLVGKGGCGKTTALFDVARQKYIIFFSATPTDVSVFGTKSDPGGIDSSFQDLVGDVDTLTSENREEESKKLVLALIIARLLLLRKFRSLPGADPEKFLLYQLSDTGQRHTSMLFRSLRSRLPTTLKSIRDELLEGTSELVEACILDEVQAGYDILLGKNIWKSPKRQEPRGIASPFIQVLSECKKCVLLAGTALSLGDAQACLSDLGKAGNGEVVREFSDLSLDIVRTKLQDWINISDLELDELKNLWLLEGRGRLLAGVIPQLRRDLPVKLADAQKIATIENAINAHASAFEDDLVRRFSRLLDDSSDKSLSDLVRKLGVSALWGGVIHLDVSDVKSIDLINSGMCSLVRVKNSDQYVLSEHLAKTAILRVAEERKVFSEGFEFVLQMCGTKNGAKGYGFEPLVVSALRLCLKDNDLKTVADFVTRISGSSYAKLPDWTKNCAFNLGGARSADARSNVAKSDVEFLKMACEQKKHQNVLLSPSAVMRPDFCGVMDGANGECWSLFVSCKLYASAFDDSDDADLNSTNPKLCYCCKDGTKNNSCNNIHAAWKKLVEKQSCFTRVLRLHVILPDLKGQKDAFRIMSDGSLVLYITFANFKQFVAQDSDIFRALKCVFPNVKM
jgi:hypothetical protein